MHQHWTSHEWRKRLEKEGSSVGNKLETCNTTVLNLKMGSIKKKRTISNSVISLSLMGTPARSALHRLPVNKSLPCLRSPLSSLALCPRRIQSFNYTGIHLRHAAAAVPAPGDQEPRTRAAASLSRPATTIPTVLGSPVLQRALEFFLGTELG